MKPLGGAFFSSANAEPVGCGNRVPTLVSRYIKTNTTTVSTH